MASPILSDRTNSDSPPLSPNKTIRRIQSSRLSRPNLSSDETLPSEHSSIFNATPVRSDEFANHGEDIMSPLDLSKGPANLPCSPSLENLDQLADLPSDDIIHVPDTFPTSHSNWPTIQLETIAERRSISTLHTSASLPRLDAAAITRQTSIDQALHKHDSASGRPSHQPWKGFTISTFPCRRSFSENDASCLPLRTPQGMSSAYKEHLSDSSSSSDELSRKRCLATWPVFPLKPPRPPPARTSTPPGLPSFGSPEAIRLMTLPGLRGASPRNGRARPSRRNRLPANVGQDRQPPSTPDLGPIENPRSPKGKSVIRRIIRSCSRSASEETPEGERRRVSLPAGFVARADDGTYVRGRFAARSSGHGVGARTSPQSVGLEGHPFHRLEPAGGRLEDAVREIDKACEDNDRASSRRAEGTVQRRAAPNTGRSPMVIPEEGGPSRGWGFWQSCRSDPDGSRGISAAPEAAGLPSSTVIPETGRPSRSLAFSQFRQSSPVDTWDLFPPGGLDSGPPANRAAFDRWCRHGSAGRTSARQDEERDRKPETCEARCWNAVYSWCCEQSSTNWEVSAVIDRVNREDELMGRRTVVSEEPGVVNARMVYPTEVS